MTNEEMSIHLYNFIVKTFSLSKIIEIFNSKSVGVILHKNEFFEMLDKQNIKSEELYNLFSNGWLSNKSNEEYVYYHKELNFVSSVSQDKILETIFGTHHMEEVADMFEVDLATLPIIEYTPEEPV